MQHEQTNLLGIENIDVDIFFNIDDEHIYVYYTDFETCPNLSEIIPLGSFDKQGRFKLKTLDLLDRIDIGMEFLCRDGYAKRDPVTHEAEIQIDQFMREFAHIPEVTNFFKPYIDLCRTDDPPYWCQHCLPSENTDCPDYCIDSSYRASENYFCSVSIPREVFTNDDLYFIIRVYFNGIYRTNAEHAQIHGIYKMLTDADLNTNKFVMITDIKAFFIREFNYFLKISPGAIIFANDYGTTLKQHIQTKNENIRQRLVEDEINFFITGFNNLYAQLVEVEEISIVNTESDTGENKWVINVFATIKQDRLIFRLVSHV